MTEGHDISTTKLTVGLHHVRQLPRRQRQLARPLLALPPPQHVAGVAAGVAEPERHWMAVRGREATNQAIRAFLEDTRAPVPAVVVVAAAAALALAAVALRRRDRRTDEKWNEL